MVLNDNNEKGYPLTWIPGDVILDLYEVRPVTEGLGAAAEQNSCHRGGFGQVYKVYHRGWNLELAMKVPLPELFEYEAQVEDFIRECETWIELGLHPHIVTCYYVRNHSGQPLIFAEYMSGGNLKDWIASGLLYEGGPEVALKKILGIAIQSARGLHYAHEQGLMHQDVKPANIMLTTEGQTKISDFGTARARARAASETVTVSPGTILVSRGGMTLAYCSPEQSLGEKLTRRTDIWSWGLTVLEMFTGEVTWASGVAAAQALEAYLKNNEIAEEFPTMPDNVALLLERCFSNEHERPKDFGQVIANLLGIYQDNCGTEYPHKEPKAAGDYAGSLNNRALSMHDLGHTEEAERLWREALKHDPVHLSANYNLGLIEWRSGRINDDVLIKRLEGLRKGNPFTRLDYLLAMVHVERLDYKSAVKLLEKAVATDSDEYEAQKLLKKLEPLKTKGAWCLRTFEGHSWAVKCADMSNNGRTALSGGLDNTLKLWDMESGKLLRTFEGHDDWVNKVCLSNDGYHALSGSYDKTIKLWDLGSGKCLRTFEGHKDVVNFVCFNFDGRYVRSGSDDNTIKLWDVYSGECLSSFESHLNSVTSTCFSFDGRYALFGGNYDSRIIVWDLECDEILQELKGHDKSILSLCFSSDNCYVLSGSEDNTLKLWSLSSGECMRTFKGHGDSVCSVCMSSDNLYALSCSEDSTVKLWDIRSGICLHTFEEHSDSVYYVCISNDNRYALSGSLDNSLKLWHLFTAQGVVERVSAQLEASLALGTEYILSSDEVFGDHLANSKTFLHIGDLKHALVSLRSARALPDRMRDRQFLDLWSSLYPHFTRSEYLDGWLLYTFAGHDDSANAVCLSAKGHYALSGSSDKTLKLWDIRNGGCILTLEGHNDWVNSVSFSTDGYYALSGGCDNKIKLWDLENSKCLRTFEGHDVDFLRRGVSSVCFSFDDCYLLSGGSDNKIKLWAMESGKCLRTFEGHTDVVSSVCFSPDSRYALSGSFDKTLKLWDIRNGGCILTLEGHNDWVNSVCFSTDGINALSGSNDNSIKLWVLKSGKCVRTLEGHTGRVNSVCLSSDGHYALSGSEDKTLKLWELESGNCLRTFEGHISAVEATFLSADGRFALSGSSDGTIILWELYWDLE